MRIVSALVLLAASQFTNGGAKAQAVPAAVSLVRDSTIAEFTVRAHTAVGRLIGIYDEQSGRPMSAVDVFDLLSGAHVQTSSTGTASLRFVRSQHDSAVIFVRKFGYRDTTILAMLSPRDSTPITLALEHQYELPEFVTTALAVKSHAMRQFEEHQLRGLGGIFVGPEDLDKEPDDRKLPDLIRARGSSAKCWFTYLDGQLMILPSGAKAGDFEAVEIYATPSSAPMEFGRKGRVEKSECGVMLLWTRERR